MRPLVSSALALIALSLAPTTVFAECDTQSLPDGTEVVEFTLTNGTICLELLRDDAPENVANFLYYVLNGDYDASLFHRHLPGFVLQGGDQRRDGSGGWETIPKKDEEEVLNEPCTPDTPGPVNPGILVCSERGNERGTVAAAKVGEGQPGGGPNSASTNFFINLADNRENLDNQNGGFTVYARVIGDGMDYVDSLMPTHDYQKQAVSSELESFAAVALKAPQGVGNYPDCFDPNTNVSAVLVPESLPSLVGKPDPRSGQFPFLLSTSCGATPVQDPLSFVAIACTGEITSEHELGVGFDPATGIVSPTPPIYFQHSCAAVDQFLAAVEAARNDASYQAAYEAEVVYIESASLSVVPEPASAWMGLSAWGTLLGLRARQARRVA